MKNYVLVLLIFCCAFVSFGQVSDLIISEYGEGTPGNAKYVEIYNGTGAAINLADYQLWKIENGGAWNEGTYNFATTTLANGATLVVANNATNTPGADEYNVGFCSWNGNDAVGLAKLGVLIDAVGTDGANPGAGWSVAGTNNATVDRTLTRKSTICSPNINWTSSAGTNTTDSEWVLTGYGNGAANSGHTVSCVAGPEIEIQGNGVEIVNGASSPNIGNATDFGNVDVAGGTNANTFTILNTGGADLNIINISSSNAIEFAITGATSGTVAPSSSINFTVTFDPNTIGTRSGIITIINDDSDEAVYTFIVEGNGTNSNLSSIIDNTNYSGTAPEFNSNTEYINFINGTTTSVGKFIPMKLRLLDGPDADGFDTVLTDISFTVEDPSNVDQLAMIKTAVLTTTAGTPLATATKIGSELVFSGMNSPFLTAPDDDPNGQLFHLRVSFDETQVVDKTKLIFKVTSATADASGSSFATTDAGGAETDSGNNNRNRLNVTADRLSFTTQPSDTSVSINMSPAPVISVTDVYGRIDLDLVGNITLTSTGTPNAQPAATISNGQAVFNTINHSVAGGPFTLSGSYSGWNVTSTPFNINNIANGSYRTIGSGNWLNNQASPAIWQRFNGSDWVASNSPSYDTSNNVYIRNGHTVSSVGSWGSSVNMFINSGGTFNANHSGTMGSIHIYSGGELHVNAAMSNNGTFEVEDNATVVINNQYGNGSETIPSLWNGTEIFHPSSIFIFNNFDCADDYLIPNNTSISSNTFNSYSAVFGTIIIDFGTNLSGSDDWALLDNGVTVNMAHGDLIFRSTSIGADMRIATTGTVTSGIGGDFIVEDVYDNTQTITFKTSGLMNFTIQGDMELNAATTRIHAGSAGTGTTVNINGDLRITPSAVLNMNPSSATGPNTKIYLKGDLEVAGSALLTNGNSQEQGEFYFSGIGDGLTDATTQTIDIASTSSIENRYMTFYVENDSYVKLIHRDFELGTNSAMEVNFGGTLDFGFSGSTALNVATSGSQTGTIFSSRSGSTLKITSPDGINTSTGSIGNVQTTASNRNFNQTANFYYIGKQNQVTGDALSIGSSVKNVYVILDNDNLELRLTNRTGISNGGKLEIQRGIVIGEEAGVNDNDFYGPNGQLIMTGGEYRISTITSDQLNDHLPQLRKYSSYSLTGGTIHLNGNDAIQVLSGVPNYYNLAYSGDNTLATGPPLPPQPYNYKGVSSATTIVNNVTISENAIVDVENNTFGGSTTNLILRDNARYVTAGTGTKPDATGNYSFEPNTTIEFNNNGGFESIRLTNPVPSYANIVVSGNNVGTTADGSGPNSFIQFQANGSFTVTGSGTFKQSNSSGFSGNINTAISNTNNPIIELLDNSTIEYAGADQIITPFTAEYKNLTVSGTGTKSLGHPTDILVGEDLNIVASTLNIDSSEAITVDEAVVVTGGSMTIEDSGSLVQINESNTNSGNITVKRHSFVKNYDYVYWSAPITGFNTNNLFQNTSSNIFFWDPIVSNIPYGGSGQGYWLDASNQIMTIGRGYIARAPAYGTITLDETIFENGSPNNGTITLNVSRGTDPSSDDDDWNLLGNPYPSSISAFEFLDENTNLDGFINLWTHGIPPLDTAPDPFYENNNGFNYDADDYIAYNGTGTTCSPNDNMMCFDGFIAAGQGFMVNTIDGPQSTMLPIRFTNAMRSKTYDNSNFFRSSNSETNDNPPVEEEKHRIWLDLASETNGVDRIVIGYVTNATTGRDRLYDAISSNKAGLQNFYSIIDAKPFVIQGRGLPFSDTDMIPLGFNSIAQDNYTIAINAVDGLFYDQTIYLKDNDLGFSHNLTTSPYTFTSEVGEFNNRFEIVFTPTALSVHEQQVTANDLSITERADGSIEFKVDKNLNITTVEILDVLGRQIYKVLGSHSTEVYNFTNLSKAAYIAKVTLSNGQVISKKAIKQH